jgi:hypothetical protein|uniref:Large terminase protein n=1 Tax=Ackermannviridae sp. ctClB2 TaxID=2825752 RepID=A0A8S5P1S0_9CAUD|nr:MAG TPA: large terminase protein [Ackermannviridae sp. ctClB2]
MEKKIVTLTREQFEIYRTCKVNPFYLANFVYIIHPVKGKVKFNLYEYQRAVLWNFLNNRFNIILKFRQAGLTELIAFFCLWLAMFNDNKNIQIISIKDMVAKRVLKRIKYMYKNLPEWLQTPVTQIRGDSFGTATVLEFVNGSSITSVPTTEEAGRSEAVSLLVIDEAAIVRWADRIWAAAFPTLSCAIYSTPILYQKKISLGKINGKEKFRLYTKVIELGSICPKERGVKEISSEEVYTLTHEGNWRKITHTQNKGNLETWYVEDTHGNIGGYTPAHRLFTTSGWKTVREIIEEDLNIVGVDTKIKDFRDVNTITKPPLVEEIKPIKDFPDFYISNLGNVYRKKKGNLTKVAQRKNKFGYFRVGLSYGTKRETGDCKNQGKSKLFQRNVHVLVAEAFLGQKPNGYQVDHIDNDKSHNYITNLRYVTPKENIEKAYKENLGLYLNPISGDRLPDLVKRGKILEMRKQGYSYKEIANEVYPDNLQASKFVKRIFEERGGRVYISKLTLVKKTIEPIYDIQVEGDHSYISADGFVNHNTGGSAILNSTPMGIGNFFHKQWVDAKNGDSYFNPIRLYWQMHPERNEEWYNSMAKSLGPRRTAQEIDGDFLSSGNTVFDLNCIRAIEECLPYPDDYLSIEQNGKLFIRRFAKPGERCFIGADVAIGRANDYSAFSVMNRYGEELAYFRGKINPSKYANLLMHTGKRFNNALIAPESNDIGLAVTSKIQDHGYPNLYYAKKLLKKKGKSKPEVEDIPGWYTTTSTRPIIIDELEEDIRFDQVNICNKFFVDESYTFIFDSRNRPVAMGKDKANDDNIYDDDAVYTDDCIMAEAITNYIRKGKKNLVTNPI